MTKSIISAAALALTLASPAIADPTVGLGFNFTFGNGGVNTGVGVRILSDDEEDNLAASIGLDYMIGTQNWRGSVGAAYLMDNSYIELNGGYDFGTGEIDFGVGFGGADTTDPSVPSDVVDDFRPDA